jgi:glycosyltransferase involved in cell wall biosynthesis
MRILVLSSTFPPHVMGGAEVSCLNLTRLLARRGHEVTVLTMAEPDETELRGEMTDDGYRLYRLHFPRKATLFSYREVGLIDKPMWHLQDYIETRNERLLRDVIEKVRPEHVNIHLLTGLGYNMLSELARHQDIGVTYFLHDLGLACIKTTMYSRNGACERQCTSCSLTGRVKNNLLSRIERLGFASPSGANMERVRRFVPEVAARPQRVIRNLVDDLPSMAPYQPHPDGTIRLLYAGRLHRTKGVDIMLDALSPLADRYKFHVTILGKGEEEEDLKRRFGAKEWVSFNGFVDHIAVARAVMETELLCMPSVWPENYSRAVLQSLCLGTPVIGSNIGGLPEQITDEETGLLVTPGDLEAWTRAFDHAFSDRHRLTVTWRENALAFGAGVNPERIAETYESLAAELHQQRPSGA